jgi:hypothetical protein
MSVTNRLLCSLLASTIVGCGAPPCSVSNAFALAAGEPTGPNMRPGNNCLRCHSANGEAASKPFSFGGTVFPSADSELCEGVAGVTVRVTDSAGRTASAVSNSVGNFWSTEPLTPPLRMEAEFEGRVAKMPGTAPTGGCALCHSWPDAVGASGRIRAP